jgi:hypothetical protein
MRKRRLKSRESTAKIVAKMEESDGSDKKDRMSVTPK